jgi:hypothetical protein
MSYEKYPKFNSWITSQGYKVDVKCYQDKENNIGYMFSTNFEDDINKVNSISAFDNSEITIYNSYSMKNIARILDIPIDDKKYYKTTINNGKLITEECDKPVLENKNKNKS